jgi:hypothetical protein
MSQENVEAIRALYERWSRNDLSVFLEVLRPDAEFVNAPDAIDPGTRTGYGGFTAAWRAIDDVWTFKDGKVSRFAWFRSSEDALKAAGLRE